MKPTPSQTRWLKKHLPKGAKPLHLVPRAYCIAKPAPGVCVFVLPPEDVIKGDKDYHRADILTVAKHLERIALGSWVTLVYCIFKDQGSWWEWTPLIDWESFRRKS